MNLAQWGGIITGLGVILGFVYKILLAILKRFPPRTSGVADELANVKAAMETLRADYDRIHSEAQQAQRDLADLRRDLATTRVELDDCQEELRATKRRADDLQEQLDDERRKQ